MSQNVTLDDVLYAYCPSTLEKKKINGMDIYFFKGVPIYPTRVCDENGCQGEPFRYLDIVKNPDTQLFLLQDSDTKCYRYGINLGFNENEDGCTSLEKTIFGRLSRSKEGLTKLSSQYNSVIINFKNVKISGSSFTADQQNQLKDNILGQQSYDYTNETVKKLIEDVIAEEIPGVDRIKVNDQIRTLCSSVFQQNKIEITFNDIEIKNVNLFIQQFNFNTHFIQNVIQPFCKPSPTTTSSTSVRNTALYIVISIMISLTFVLIFLIIFLFM